MKAEASESFLNREIYYRNTTKLFTAIPNTAKILFLCGKMDRSMYAESGAEIHIGFNLILVRRLFTGF